MITKPKIAYKIGLSCSLSRFTISAYQDILKWPFPEKEDVGLEQYMTLRKYFFKGYKDGAAVLKQVKYENAMNKRGGKLSTFCPYEN